MEIPLKFPYKTAGGVQVNAVNVSRLKVRHIKRISEQSGGKPDRIELLGVATMVGLVEEDLDDMDAADYQVLKERFLDLLGITGAGMAGGGDPGAVVPLPAQ